MTGRSKRAKAGEGSDGVGGGMSPAVDHVPCEGIENFSEIPRAFIHPTMMPFVTTLRAGKEEVLYFNIPDANHNEFSMDTAKEVMNNILNDVLGHQLNKPRTLGKDVSMVMLYSDMSENVRDGSPVHVGSVVVVSEIICIFVIFSRRQKPTSDLYACNRPLQSILNVEYIHLQVHVISQMTGSGSGIQRKVGRTT